jgi:hypothetical protein
MVTENKLDMGEFRVYRFGEHPKPKKYFFKETFPRRQQARNFCRNRSWEDGLTIVHPNGTEEPYT